MPEDTLLLIKPDAYERTLVGTILSRVEQQGLSVHRIRTVDADPELLAQHYEKHRDEDFYDSLIDFMQETPIIAAHITGQNAVKNVRELAGDTEPVSAAPGTIRGDLGTDSYEQADREDRAVHNLVHAADGPESAARELGLWFPDTD